VIDEAEAMLADPNLIEIIRQDFATIGVVGEERLAMTLYVVGTSRLLSQPLAAIVQGPSSTGKSHVIASVGALFPKVATLPATDITPNALYYGPVDALGELPPAATNLLSRLRERYLAASFTTTQATRDDPTITDSRKMAGYLKTLAEHGAVELYETGHGSRPHTWLVKSAPEQFGDMLLPDPKSIEFSPDDSNTASSEPESDGGEPKTEVSS
jgi:hypothetical protein